MDGFSRGELDDALRTGAATAADAQDMSPRGNFKRDSFSGTEFRNFDSAVNYQQDIVLVPEFTQLRQQGRGKRRVPARTIEAVRRVDAAMTRET